MAPFIGRISRVRELLRGLQGTCWRSAWGIPVQKRVLELRLSRIPGTVDSYFSSMPICSSFRRGRLDAHGPLQFWLESQPWNMHSSGKIIASDDSKSMPDAASDMRVAAARRSREFLQQQRPTGDVVGWSSAAVGSEGW
jgi:hypothetical protein